MDYLCVSSKKGTRRSAGPTPEWGRGMLTARSQLGRSRKAKAPKPSRAVTRARQPKGIAASVPHRPRRPASGSANWTGRVVQLNICPRTLVIGAQKESDANGRRSVKSYI